MKVVGYKWLHLDAPVRPSSRVTLVSAYDAREWTRGANCASYAPSPQDLWGFNAYYGARRARWAGRTYGTVMVGLVGFGAVALFQRGWRAEKAEIVAVFLPRSFWLGIEKDVRPRFVERLRGAYDVPVLSSLSALRRETERWGVPGKVFLRGGE